MDEDFIKKQLTIVFRKYGTIFKVIIPGYKKSKKDFLTLTDDWFKRITSNGKGRYIPTNEDLQIKRQEKHALQECIFYYESFFIFSTIFLDAFAKVLSGKKSIKFDNINEKNVLDEFKNLIKFIRTFKPYAEKIKYFRDKLFAHQEILFSIGGSTRHSSIHDKIEFIIADFGGGPSEKDSLKLKSIRDKYSNEHPLLKLNENYWETLILFEKLPITFTHDEKRTIHELKKNYGMILPELEVFIEKLEEFLKNTEFFKEVDALDTDPQSL